MSSQVLEQQDYRLRAFMVGLRAALPLTLAIVPWGLLAGSFALEAGLSGVEGQAMSVFVFAGAVQLVVLGMIGTNAGLSAILITTFLITSRHFLYGMSMRSHMSQLPLRWRLALGFLLTDELFALTGTKPPEQFNRWHALGIGLSLYMGWNLATAAGIIAGQQIPNMESLGLEFAVAATFIALVVPGVRKVSTLCAVFTALLTSVACELYQVETGLLIASLLGMAAGTASAYLLGEPLESQEGEA
ncbi:AzlC family ABC transporter permease [Pontibacterium sp.]|uniref:AzlC family ABC transporter permease n=1 Tax=Pontibacterium sp. TaxID=2036026 RepID=UPI0035151349